MALEVLDIFSDGNDVRRATIRNLNDSYSFPFDLLSEMIQNAVDAIRRHISTHGQIRQHEIRIELDRSSRTIRVSDTGTGIDPDQLHLLIGPHVGTKHGDPLAIGEKGVGMTFAAFSCDNYLIESSAETGRILASMEGNAAWLAGSTESAPKLHVLDKDSGSIPPTETGTTVSLSNVTRRDDLNDDLFSLTLPSLVWILRTQTAIGSTRSLFGGAQEDIAVNVTWKDISGEATSQQIPFKFLALSELLTAKSVVDLNDFIGAAARYSDEQKRAKLEDKVLEFRGQVERSNRVIRFIAYRVPNRDLWDDLSEKNHFYLTDENGERHNLVGPGIFVATKGMPTAVKIEAPKTGYSGDWPTVLILIEDTIRFDLGRKTVPPRTTAMLKDICKDYFNDNFLPYRRYIGEAGDGPDFVPAPVAFVTKAKEFERIGQLSDLELDKISYLKHPDRQEAAVVAIFHELVGAGELEAFSMARTGYRQRYDSWGYYEHPVQGVIPIVVEFKFNAESILDDVQDRRKFFEELDLIVCWDLHAEHFAPSQVAVSHEPPHRRFFSEAQYKLTWPTHFNLGQAGVKPVLALRPFVDALRHDSDSVDS